MSAPQGSARSQRYALSAAFLAGSVALSCGKSGESGAENSEVSNSASGAGGFGGAEANGSQNGTSLPSSGSGQGGSPVNPVGAGGEGSTATPSGDAGSGTMGEAGAAAGGTTSVGLGGFNAGGSNNAGGVNNAGGSGATTSGTSGSGGQGLGGANNGGASSGGTTGNVGAVCDGATDRPAGTATCRDSAECTMPGDSCWMVIPTSGGCGNPTFLPMQCAVDIDCGDGNVCQTDNCGATTCVPACSEANCNGTNSCVDGQCVARPCDEPGASECGIDFECQPDVATDPRGCVAVRCEDGFECETNWDCSSGAPGADLHGCVQRACADDSDCDCGFCVNALCEPTLGLCGQLLATPYGCVWPDDEFV